MRQLTCVLTFLTASLSAVGFNCDAQTYPNKPVRIVVPVAAGGPTDILTRTLSQKFAETWGQQVLVENRAGGGSNIGFEFVAKSAADGYTLLMAQPAFTVNVSLYKNLPYDPLRDFVTISLAATYPMLLVSHPSMPARSIKELVNLAKTKLGRLSIASSGNGTTAHLAVEWFNTLANIRLTHIPYKGAAPATVDLLGGHVDLAFVSPPTVLTAIQQRRLTALAITGSARHALLAGVPTFIEYGFPEFIVMGWYGLVAPAGTPRDIVNIVRAEVVKALAAGDIKEKLHALGLDPVGSTPEQFTTLLKDEVSRWAKVVKASGAKPD